MMGEGDGDVAAPVLGIGTGRRCLHRRGEGLWERATWTSPPRPWDWDGEAMSSAPDAEGAGTGHQRFDLGTCGPVGVAFDGMCEAGGRRREAQGGVG